MTKEEQFWNWFKENEVKYFFLNDEEEKEGLLDDFLDHLHFYCENLFFQIGGDPHKEQDLIITAGGNIDYFDAVETLVNHAPHFERWNVIAFIPPMGNGIVDYENVRLDPELMYFNPLSSSKSTKIGLRIHVENYDPNNDKDFLTASYILLDNVLGEKSNALDIGYIEVENIPTSIVERDKLIEFTKLPSYIKWKKSKLN